MLLVSESPRTSIVTDFAYFAKYIVACPAELAPPIRYTLSPSQDSASVWAAP